MTTNTYGGYTVDQLREFIRHHYDAQHGGDNIDELTNDSSASVKIVRDLLDAIEPQRDGDLLRPIARWVYNAVRVNLDLLHGICAEFGCPQGEDVATWLRARLAGVPVPCTCTGVGPCENRTGGSCRRKRAAASAPADERATFVKLMGYDRPETEGVAVDVWDSQRATWLEALDFARSYSANETGAEGSIELPHWFEMFLTNVCEISDRNSPDGEPDAIVATLEELRNCALNAIEQCISYAAPARSAENVRAWETDDGRVITDLQKQQALHDGGASASSVQPYAHALYRRVPAHATAPAIYQILTEEGAWLDTTREYYDRTKSDPALARVVYSAPQPTAQAVGRAGLTDEQRAVMQDAVRSISLRADELKESNTALDGTWCDADEKAAYEAEVRLIERLRALLAAHPILA
ncbi:hypothetical protein [Burkholderia cenocepacia]|uniref:hypothetical protein n=1 Tax=Burkholderia cenocepacia TaxID=95486 RepID=UPI002ABD607C|nr:hypothetical protein [Burkholderia cenocepacia]